MYFHESWSLGVHNLCAEVNHGRANGHINRHMLITGMLRMDFPLLDP